MHLCCINLLKSGTKIKTFKISNEYLMKVYRDITTKPINYKQDWFKIP